MDRLPRGGLAMAVAAVWALAAGAGPHAAAAEGWTAAETVLLLPWGDGEGELGRKVLDQGASEGPMSFAVAPDGDLVVLDQVNRRVLRVTPDGALVRETPIPTDTYQDVAVAPDGTVVVLDRLVRTALLVLDEDGGPGREVPVLGPGVPEGGLLTGTFARADGVWLEVGHSQVVRVLDEQGQPCPRAIRAGRPIGDGERAAVAYLDGLGGVQLRLEQAAGGQVLAATSLYLEWDIPRIAWLEGDAAGRVVVVVHLMEYDPLQGRHLLHEEVAGVVYGPDLEPLAEFRSPYVITALEQHREFVVTAAGDVWQMAFTDAGVRFLRWSAP